MQRVQDMEITSLHLTSDSCEDTKAIATLLYNLPHVKDIAWGLSEAASIRQDHPMVTLRSRSITWLRITLSSEVNQFRLDMPNLTCLTFYSSSFGRRSMACSTELFESLVTCCPCLNQLSCDLEGFGNFPFNQLIRFANLTAINLAGGGKIQEPIETIFPRNITELCLGRVEFDVNGMPALLSTLTNLYSLMLGGIPRLSSIEGWFSKSVRFLNLNNLSLCALPLSSHFPSLCEVTSFSKITLHQNTNTA